MNALLKTLGALALLAAAPLAPAAAQQAAAVLPADITAATCTGYWEGAASLPEDAATPAPQDGGGAAPGARHGYYKLYAVRQPDGTSKVYLQQIAATDDGPQVLSTVELRELSSLKAHVTDIRPENSGGIIREPGLFASVILKTEPDSEPEDWTVLIDDLGEIRVEKAE